MSKSLAMLVLAVVLSAFAVIQLRYSNRQTFAELQSLTQQRDTLNTEWGQLLLEQGVWSEHRRVEETAHVRLGMAQPSNEQVVIVGVNRRAP